MQKEEVFKLFDAISQRNRIEIIKVLSDGKSRYISEIAEKVGLSRTATSYHLDVLESVGIVEHEYKIIVEPHSVGRLGSFYKLNEKKLKEALEAIREILPRL
jgi:DNA-binding transcriptional ArsR family regulator